MARHWHRLALATACASWFVVTACSSHAGSASAGYRTSTHVVDHHAVDAAWSTLLPPMPAGWQVAHTPEELTLQQAEAVFPAGSHLASELSFAGFLRGVRRAIGGDCTCGGRMAVEERLFQFKTAGGAAEWFTELVGSVYPMVGSPVAKLSPVRDDGGAFVAVAPKYMVHGSHVGVGVALEGDLVITEIGYAQRPLASADVSQILQRAEESAGRGITRAVPAHFPNLA